MKTDTKPSRAKPRCQRLHIFLTPESRRAADTLAAVLSHDCKTPLTFSAVVRHALEQSVRRLRPAV